MAFGVELAVGAVGNDTRLLAMGAIPDTGTMAKEYWRLLSYTWLHAGSLHLFMNAALLWWVGRIVERRTGCRTMLGVYLACALAGGSLIAWNASMHPKPGVSLGASAGISGLLTCALVLMYRPSAAAFGRALCVRVTLWAASCPGSASWVTRAVCPSREQAVPGGNTLSPQGTCCPRCPVRRYFRASSTMLNGVSSARRKIVKPPSFATAARRASPACAPSAAPTSWLREFGVQTVVENA